MCEALVEHTIPILPSRRFRGAMGVNRICLILCRATFGDNHTPDIKSNNTIPTLERETHNVALMSGGKIFSLNRQIIKNAWFERS